MYPGWVVCGEGDPLAGSEFSEIINNARAYTYAAEANICWLHPCNDCPPTSVVVPGGPFYTTPKNDPAPWYDPDDPDSEGFLGVIGLDITGSESSTLQASVTMALTGGGVIGPPYHGPRTLTMRALLIAEEECSLQYGINWLREVCGMTADSCVGESLTFFDCCPCVCEDPAEGVPCWADNYRELADVPLCLEDTDWVQTYAQLRTGIPGSEAFPTWPATYAQFRTGMPDAQCWPVNYLQVKDSPTCVDEARWPTTYEGLKLGADDPENFPTWPTDYIGLRNGTGDAVCWPFDYGELRRGPPCAQGDTVCWWPFTYAELMEGPPDQECWCSWPRFYKRLRTGPPTWSCCADMCITPYLRQYHNVRMTEGPTMLRHPAMSSGGAMCEVEMVYVAADPIEHALQTSRGSFQFTNPVLVDETPPPATMSLLAAPSDPFAIPGRTTLSTIATLARPVAPLAGGPTTTTWSRTTHWTKPSPFGNVLSMQAPVIDVRTFAEQSGEVRVAVWQGEQRIGGWFIPFIPAHTTVTIDVPRRKVYGTDSAYGTRSLSSFVRGWDGGMAEYPRLDHGNMLITVDQARGLEVRLLTSIATAAIGANG